MFRNIILIFISIAVSQSVTLSKPKNIEIHNNSFSLNRTITIVAAKGDESRANEVRQALDKVGISTKIVRSGFLRRAKITLKQSASIENIEGQSAYTIKISKNKVDIQYTDDISWQKAIKYLQSIITNTHIAGHTVSDWVSGEITKVKGVFFDAYTNLLSTSQIENYIKNPRGEKAYIQLVSPKHWRLESSVFKLVNPKESIYPSSGHYSLSQIATLLQQHNKGRNRVVIVIDLISPNSEFERVTGHTLSSVEGMRFVRAIIEEYAAVLKCEEICIGSSTKEIDKRYLEFIDTIAERIGVELTIQE